MSAKYIARIMGIVNGTTNYILTRMKPAEWHGYDEALKTAIGFRMCDGRPYCRCDGSDAGRKIAIMASIAFHSRVTFSDVYIEGIRNITQKIFFMQNLIQ